MKKSPKERVHFFLEKEALDRLYEMELDSGIKASAIISRMILGKPVSFAQAVSTPSRKKGEKR